MIATTGNQMARPWWAYKDYGLFVDFKRFGLYDKRHRLPFPKAGYGSNHYGFDANGDLVTYGPDEYARDADGRVVTYGAYENLLIHSEALNNWGTTGSITVTANQEIAPDGNNTADQLDFTASTGDGVYVNIDPLGETTYNFSIWAKVASGTKTFRMRCWDNVTGSQYSADFTVTTEWQRFDFVATTGAGITSNNFSIYNGSAGDAGTVFFWGAQVTDTPYTLPYVATGVDTTQVSATYSDDNSGDAYGPRLPMTGDPELTDPDEYWEYVDGTILNSGNLGSTNYYEVVTTETDYFGSGVVIGDRITGLTTALDSSNTVKQIQPSQAYLNMQQSLINAFDGEADGDLEDSGNLVAGNYYQVITTETDHFGTGVIVGDRITGLTTALDSNNTVKQISPASLTAVWKGRFGFDWDQAVLGDFLILNADDSTVVPRLLYNRGSGGHIRTHDGTNESQAVSVNWQANTDYTATLKVGPHPDYADAPKMQLTVTDGTTTWESDVEDFDGSFDPADFLFFGYQNDYPVYHESLTIKKEAEW